MRSTLLSVLSLLPLIGACEDKASTSIDTTTVVSTGASIDAAGAGFAEATECNDSDASVNPGAVELCDGIDNDCDGDIDEGVTGTYFDDADGDGFGAGAPIESCVATGQQVTNESDCDDTDGEIHPGAAEICDGIDNDCDGETDEDGVRIWYADIDGDGHGDPDASVEDCTQPSGYTAEAGDCDDQRADVNPDAEEVCEGADNDCDGEIDEGVLSVWYQDADGDGYGETVAAVEACEAPSGFSADDGDCNDLDPDYHPGADESDCTDPSDYNCDGSVGYVDADSDGYAACEECDDSDAAVRPDADEVCNDTDDDCDGLIDDDDTDLDTSTASTWYTDGDGDGHGDSASSTVACEAPSDAVGNDADCDDDDAAVSPDAAEVCNDTDDDCDGLIDDDDTDLDTSTQTDWYTDADGDGYGDADTETAACEPPSGSLSDGSDCDDGDAAVNPDADEICNDIDDDCDGLVDDDDADLDTRTASIWYADADGDGYGDEDTNLSACNQPSSHVADDTDCDDSAADVNPGAAEICNGIDDDCDDDTDDDDSVVSGTSSWYDDDDADGYGDPDSVTEACEGPDEHVADDTDCDDLDAAVNPAAAEICNEIDDDCNGLVDDDDTDLDTSTASTWYDDTDGDGYGDSGSSTEACDQPSGQVSDYSDCDDSDATVGAPAVWYADDDCDGFGDSGSSISSCTEPSGYNSDSTDCDDADSRAHPGAQEICIGVDHDCDGTLDNDCDDATDVGASAWDAIESPGHPYACGLIGELSSSYDSHSSGDLTGFMSILEGSTSGLTEATSEDVEFLDYSIRYGGDHAACPGNYSSTTTSWPAFSSTGSQGAARFRGYFNIGCGDPLNYTFGLIGNDSLTFSIEGATIATVNWNDGQWMKFRYVSFPEPGLYAFEVQWSTNLCCTIDPFELVWSEGFVAGYGDYDEACDYSSCTYGTGVQIPGFDIITTDHLLQATDGGSTGCEQCSSNADCDATMSCNTAGICE